VFRASAHRSFHISEKMFQRPSRVTFGPKATKNRKKERFVIKFDREAFSFS